MHEWQAAEGAAPASRFIFSPDGKQRTAEALQGERGFDSTTNH